MAEQTLTYSPGAQGWPSFYSFIPEFMAGMNNYFYSFSGGNLYRHNTNETRNNYYGQQYSSTLKGVFNADALETKLFKTLQIEGTSPWGAALTSDIHSGEVDTSYFEKKEGAWFAFIRALQNDINFLMRSANGIGIVETVTGTSPIVRLNFGSIDLGSILAVGDYVYTGTGAVYGGQVVTISGSGVDVDVTVLDPIGTTATAPVAGDYVFYLKNSVAESHGVTGKYCEYELTNSDTSAVELVAVESEVMKSHP